MIEFNLWDIGFALIVGFFALRGFRMGAIDEIISMVVLFAAIVSGFIFAIDVGNLIFDATAEGPSHWAFPVGFLLVFAAVFVAGTIVRSFGRNAVDVSRLKHADNMIGLLIGASKGLLLVLIFAAIAGKYWSDATSVFNSFTVSSLSPFLEDITAALEWLVGEEPAISE